MSHFDLSHLGDWGKLPFFQDDLPGIAAKLAAETRPFFPPAPRVFAALERCQPADVKVVILGQDPYHAPGKADGLAFSIPSGFGGPLHSLGNILKELHDDLGVTRSRTDLFDWADQGVLLLNAVALTVPQGKAKGHAKFGWQALTAQVLDHLSPAPRAYLLWGNPALAAGAAIDPKSNLKIETAHPSPLSVHRGFFGSRPFSRTNDWLQAQGMSAINWA